MSFVIVYTERCSIKMRTFPDFESAKAFADAFALRNLDSPDDDRLEAFIEEGRLYRMNIESPIARLFAIHAAWRQCNTKRIQRVLIMFAQGRTLEQIAAYHTVPRERVRQMIMKGVRQAGL